MAGFGESNIRMSEFLEQTRSADEFMNARHEGGGNMRYAMAFVCPPLALLGCRRKFQAIPSAILYALAIASANFWIGASIDFLLILWAVRVVVDEQADRESRAFVETVEPIPVIRS